MSPAEQLDDLLDAWCHDVDSVPFPEFPNWIYPASPINTRKWSWKALKKSVRTSLRNWRR